MALGPPLALAAVSTSSSMIFACIVAQFGSSGSYCNPQKSKYILKHLDVWYIVRCLLSGSALQMHVFSLWSPSDHIFPHVFEILHHIWSYLHLPCSAPVQLLWHHECHSFPGHSLRTNLPLLLTGRRVVEKIDVEEVVQCCKPSKRVPMNPCSTQELNTAWWIMSISTTTRNYVAVQKEEHT